MSELNSQSHAVWFPLTGAGLVLSICSALSQTLYVGSIKPHWRNCPAFISPSFPSPQTTNLPAPFVLTTWVEINISRIVLFFRRLWNGSFSLLMWDGERPPAAPDLSVPSQHLSWFVLLRHVDERWGQGDVDGLMGDNHSGEGRALSDVELQLSLWRCSILPTQLLFNTELTGSSWTTDDPVSV